MNWTKFLTNIGQRLKSASTKNLTYQEKGTLTLKILFKLLKMKSQMNIYPKSSYGLSSQVLSLRVSTKYIIHPYLDFLLRFSNTLKNLINLR